MTKVNISLKTIDDVKSFVDTLSVYDCDFDLVSGRYIIDAKSLMGILSLELSKALELDIHTDDPAEVAKIRESIKPFLVD